MGKLGFLVGEGLLDDAVLLDEAVLLAEGVTTGVDLMILDEVTGLATVELDDLDKEVEGAGTGSQLIQPDRVIMLN
jgi:hypothetical protein